MMVWIQRQVGADGGVREMVWYYSKDFDLSGVQQHKFSAMVQGHFGFRFSLWPTMFKTTMDDVVWAHEGD